MKRFYSLILLLLSANLSSFAIGEPVKHPYFVSITQIDFNAQSKSLEISIKIFTSDLEQALNKKTAKKLNINTPQEVKDANIYLEQYLQSHFSLLVNNQKANIRFIGKEKEDDATWCYLEVSKISHLSSIQVSNSILTEIFDSQSNIVHIKVANQQKSMLLNRRKTTDSVNF